MKSDSILIIVKEKEKRATLLVRLLDNINKNITIIEKYITYDFHTTHYALHAILGISGVFGLEKLYYATLELIKNNDGYFIRDKRYNYFIQSASETKEYIIKLIHFID
jgi:hypothetical protein